jgi:hypothetical protein
MNTENEPKTSTIILSAETASKLKELFEVAKKNEVVCRTKSNYENRIELAVKIEYDFYIKADKNQFKEITKLEKP